MAKSELLQIRVPTELKKRLKENRVQGQMSAYVRGLIEADMGLAEKTVAGNPIAEPRVPDMAIQPATVPDITALARRRWPHLPLAVAEKKVRAE